MAKAAKERRRPAAAPAAPSPAELPAWVPVAAWAVFAALTLLGYARAVPLGFSNDDYLVLRKVLLTPLPVALGWSELISGWWRPVSRELHFWMLAHVAGVRAPAFHAANLALWLADVALLLALLRRVAGARVAVLAAAGATAASAWGLYVVWAACAQDLWMLAFVFAFLLALLDGRRALAAVAFALALLSKELAVLALPLGAWLLLALRGRGALRLRDWAAPVAIAIGWVVVHPSLGGHWWFGSAERVDAVPAALAPARALRGLLAPVNLELPPAPGGSLVWTAAECAAWALGIGGTAALAVRGWNARAAAPARGAWIRAGLGWWAIGWLPFALAPLRWHSYYGWIGLCGLWLAVAAALLPRPRVLVALLAGVALLRPLQCASRVDEWSTEAYQEVAAARTDRVRDGLLALHPTLPPHTRIFALGLPSGTGIRTGPRRSAAASVWYRDSSVAVVGLHDYRPRTAGEAAGPDYFYLISRDDLSWLPLEPEGTGVPESLRRRADWRNEVEKLAARFADSGQWSRARASYARLAIAYPDAPDFAFNLGVSLAREGETGAARAWLDRADSLVGSPPRGGHGYLAAQGR